MVVWSDSTVDMVNKLRISSSLAIVQVSITLSSKVLHSGVVVSSVERSHGPVEMVDQLGASLGLPLSIEVSKPGSQVVVGGSKVCIVNRSDGPTKVANKLGVGGGSKTAQDQKLHVDFWSPSK